MAGKRDSDGGGRTPSTKRVRLNVVDGTRCSKRKEILDSGAPESVGLVTPAGGPKMETMPRTKNEVRRELFPSALTDNNGEAAKPAAVTPARILEEPGSPVKRKLLFGRMVTEVHIPANVRKTYRIVGRLTSSIGGNASGGPIYGELTMSSMQKMVNLMKKHTSFDSRSSFIDVGSGIGKPNLHVTQDPGVEFSYGIEVHHDRWLLGANCLRAVLDAAHEEQLEQKLNGEEERTEPGVRLGYRCIFEHSDIRKADSFDPFTHVYMFSIG